MLVVLCITCDLCKTHSQLLF